MKRRPADFELMNEKEKEGIMSPEGKWEKKTNLRPKTPTHGKGKVISAAWKKPGK